MRNFYAFAAIAGTLIPWYFFGSFIAANGPNLIAFIQAPFVNGVAAGFSADILISIAVFWVWSFLDARQKNLRHWWLVLPSASFVGLSLALPLYLWMREDA